jgi:hypothetical protein
MRSIYKKESTRLSMRRRELHKLLLRSECDTTNLAYSLFLDKYTDISNRIGSWLTRDITLLDRRLSSAASICSSSSKSIYILRSSHNFVIIRKIPRSTLSTPASCYRS